MLMIRCKHRQQNNKIKNVLTFALQLKEIPCSLSASKKAAWSSGDQRTGALRTLLFSATAWSSFTSSEINEKKKIL